MSNDHAQISRRFHADCVAIAAVIGGPYIAVRRRWDEGKGGKDERSRETDDVQKKVSTDGKQDGVGSVERILQGDSRELAKLRDAVR